MTLDEFFAGHKTSRSLFDALHAVIASTGLVELRVTKSQIAFVHERPFAWAWVPDGYLRGRHAPLVLSLALRRRDESPRWKQVVEPARGRFMHYLELYAGSDLDDECRRAGLRAESRRVLRLLQRCRRPVRGLFDHRTGRPPHTIHLRPDRRPFRAGSRSRPTRPTSRRKTHLPTADRPRSTRTGNLRGGARPERDVDALGWGDASSGAHTRSPFERVCSWRPRDCWFTRCSTRTES